MAEQTEQATSKVDEWELLQIRSQVRLVAFAIEAERVLSQVEDIASKSKEFESLLRGYIDARCQWIEYAGDAPLVLDGIYFRLGRMLDLEG